MTSTLTRSDRLLYEIRLESSRLGHPEFSSHRLVSLVRRLDESLCAGDEMPEEWNIKPRRPRQVTITVVEGYL